MLTIDEVYTGKTRTQIETGLKEAGKLAETMRKNGLSLTMDNRMKILDARVNALKFGFSTLQIELYEQEGAREVQS